MDLLSVSAACDDGPATLAVIPIIAPALPAIGAMIMAGVGVLITLIVKLLSPRTIKRIFLLAWAQKFIVGPVLVGLAGIVLVMVYVVPILFPPIQETVSAHTTDSGTDWSLWRGSARRTGYVPGAEDPAHGKIVWSFDLDGVKTFYASPAIVGNRLYITSAQWEVFKDRGAVICLDAETGKTVWTFQGDGYRATFSSPAVSGKYLVVGEGLHIIKDARVFCIDVEKSEQERKGVKLWSYRTKSHVESSPCIADGRVYVGAGDDGLYCFALDPDEKGQAQVLWHLEGKDFPDCETAPVVLDGKVYWSLGVGGQAVCAADAVTGKLLWRMPTPAPTFGSPSVANGKLYVGMGFGDFINTAEDLARNLRNKLEGEGKAPEEIQAAVSQIKSGGEVWCIDLTTFNGTEPPQVTWKYEVGGTVLGASAVDGGRVYAGCRDGFLYCLSADKGELVGKFNAREPIVTSPAVGANHVYVVAQNQASSTGWLFGLDKNDLGLIWTVSLGGPSFSSPAVAHGHVYAGTSNSGLLCLGQPGREKPRPFWAGPMGGPGKGGCLDGSLMPPRGAFAWAFAGRPEGAGENAPPAEIHSPAAYTEGAFYIGMNRQDARGLAKLLCAEGLQEQPSLAWFARSSNPVYLSAAATDRRVYFVDGRPGDTDRLLHCLDAETGEEVSNYPVADDASGLFFLTDDDILLLADTATGLTCLDDEYVEPGRELWKADVGHMVGSPVLVNGSVVVAVESPPRLASVELTTGKPGKGVALPSAPQTGPVVTKGKVWVGTKLGLHAYEATDRRAFAQVPCGSVVAPLVSEGDRLAATTEAGEIVLVDAGQGNEVARTPGAVGRFPPVLTGAGVLYVGKDSIQRYDMATKKSAQWARITAVFPGSVLSPMIMVDSNVFFATDKEGFICMKARK